MTAALVGMVEALAVTIGAVTIGRSGQVESKVQVWTNALQPKAFTAQNHLQLRLRATREIGAMMRKFWKHTISAVAFLILGFPADAFADQAQRVVAPEPSPSISPKTGLSVQWEELTTGDFVKALTLAQNVCILPFGVIEKHGPSGPMGTDLLNVRHIAVSAAMRDYAIVFPPYYFGQIAEAGAQPGTLVYKRSTQLALLEETVSEMARNGCRKVFIANGHGGNNSLIPYFIQTQLDSPRDYVVYSGTPQAAAVSPAARAMSGPSKPGADGHGGESETAMIMSSRPGLAFPERGGQESGADQNRLTLPAGINTAMAWYARYPNHYMGDASGATKARGDLLMEQAIEAMTGAIQAIKADQTTLKIQREFFAR